VQQGPGVSPASGLALGGGDADGEPGAGEQTRHGVGLGRGHLGAPFEDPHAHPEPLQRTALAQAREGEDDGGGHRGDDHEQGQQQGEAEGGVHVAAPLAVPVPGPSSLG
jgi:hypothetical protein